VSILVTSLVWKYSRAEGSTLLTALAIADFADDDGCAFPSVATLSSKARVSERTTQYALETLCGLGELCIERGTGPKGCNTYFIRVQNLRGANSAGVQSATEGGATGCTQTVIEPPKKKKESAKPAITFDAQRAEFIGVSDEQITLWSKANPLVNVRAELTRAACWLMSNPARAKSQYPRFLNGWMTRSQERAQAAALQHPAAPRQPSKADRRQSFADHLFADHQPEGDSNVIDVDAREID
jgi:hypothetical protein